MSTETALADLHNFKRYARPSFNIMIIDDVNCFPDYCQGPVKALNTIVKEGGVEILANFSISPEDSRRGFTIGEYI